MFPVILLLEVLCTHIKIIKFWLKYVCLSIKMLSTQDFPKTSPQVTLCRFLHDYVTICQQPRLREGSWSLKKILVNKADRVVF